ncbi:hypothetical protein HK098_002068 [Nowakowskiella sp. JEL0407]|nr:hypothetical protein HK098_002068 [Nowakowskiella sp. JEL0407]
MSSSCTDIRPVYCPDAPYPFNCASAGSTCCAGDVNFGSCLRGFLCTDTGCVLPGVSPRQSPSPTTRKTTTSTTSSSISTAISSLIVTSSIAPVATLLGQEPSKSLAVSPASLPVDNVSPTSSSNILSSKPQETNSTPIIVGSVVGVLAIAIAVLFFVKFMRDRRNKTVVSLPQLPYQNVAPVLHQQPPLQPYFQQYQPQSTTYINSPNYAIQPFPNNTNPHVFNNVNNAYVNSAVGSSNANSESTRYDDNQYLSSVPSNK